MRVTNSAAPTAPNQGSSARTASAPAFALSRTPSVTAASPTGAAAQVAGLLALQDLLPSVDERRRQALRRGHGLLDALDQLQRGLLHGIAAQPAVRRLRAELTQADHSSLDDRLRGILSAIEVRGAVELAKRENHDRID
jgi:Class II flagellar assembly regulator